MTIAAEDCPCCLRDTNLNWTKPAAMNLTLMYFTVLSHLVRSLAHPEPGLFQPGIASSPAGSVRPLLRHQVAVVLKGVDLQC